MNEQDREEHRWPQESGEPGDRPFIRVTNATVYAELQAARADLRDLAKDFAALAKDYTETKSRTRRLELKFYGVVAGLVTALAIIGSGVIPR